MLKDLVETSGVARKCVFFALICYCRSEIWMLHSRVPSCGRVGMRESSSCVRVCACDYQHKDEWRLRSPPSFSPRFCAQLDWCDAGCNQNHPTPKSALQSSYAELPRGVDCSALVHRVRKTSHSTNRFNLHQFCTGAVQGTFTSSHTWRLKKKNRKKSFPRESSGMRCGGCALYSPRTKLVEITLFWVVTTNLDRHILQGLLAGVAQGVCTKIWRWVISRSSPWRHPPLIRYKHNKLRIPNTAVILFVYVLPFWYLLTWVNHTHSCPSSSWILCIYTSTLFTWKKLTVQAGFFQSSFDRDPPFSRFPPQYYRLGCDCARD